MFDTTKLDEAMGILGELTSEQRDLVLKATNAQKPEQELYDGLKGLGADLDEATFQEFLNAAAKTSEDEIFDQEVSPDELEAVAGGSGDWSCTKAQLRDIYYISFPNCAATVEDGSWCGTNDACYKFAVMYQNMRDCVKAWR